MQQAITVGDNFKAISKSRKLPEAKLGEFNSNLSTNCRKISPALPITIKTTGVNKTAAM